KLRAAFPGASFTTDIIVGFPGETEADFEESAAFVREIGFLKVHVFSFSRRAGTPAYDMPDQIDEAEKARRSHRLQAEADAVRARVIAGMEGCPVEVLLEKPVNNTLFTGYTREYVPVLLKAPGHRQGGIVHAVLGAFDGTRCAAALAE
ncbi:MAG: tRNA (N(6)-L-threonylcarbamoyladenosine(37)-C(2))-methylthiotransferase MtaB, partial [Ruthenibacterium sp.]|nr:tRNA (N(6)-L-threonylcarbamoyladenosine(37)-C(2))-methylthiotransferase MtaB [Ruthenibacterium sp.]